MGCIAVSLMVIMTNGIAGMADEDADIDALQASIEEKEGELDQLEEEKNALLAGRTNIENIINGLEAAQSEMETYVTELDNQLLSIQSNIDNLNQLIAEKEAEIVIAQAELEEAEAVAVAQYEAMKARIQFMYERGDNMFLEMLVSADSFADMLNKADYIEQLSALSSEIYKGISSGREEFTFYYDFSKFLAK